jgi:hypothetical protein
MAIAWRGVAPDSAPGGLVFVVSAGGYVWLERRVPLEAAPAPGTVERAALGDRKLCDYLAGKFGEATLTTYDGDTGEAVARYTVTPE